MLLGGTPRKKPESMTLGDDDKVRRWRGGRERDREVFIGEPHTEDSYFRVKAPKKGASFVKARFSMF